MKKIILFASALAGLFLAASCQQEKLEPEVAKGPVTFTVEVPAAMQTKAIADASTVDQLIYEVWLTTTHGDLVNGAQKLYQAETPIEGGKATLTLDLVNDQNFTVLFWAQKAGTGVYDTDELNAVTYTSDDLEYAYAANLEALAAFYGKAYVADTKHVGAEVPGKVILRRPFAQINLGTINTSAEANSTTGYEIVVENSNMIIADVPTVFNVVNGEVDAPKTMKFAMNLVPSGEDATITVGGKEYSYVGMNYVFAGDNVTLTYNIQTKLNNGMTATVNNTINTVPVAENFRTNIIGNLLTSKTDFDIIVDAEFNEPEKVYELWDGESISEPEAVVDNTTGETTYVVDDPSELAYLAALVNGTLPSTFATKAAAVQAYNISLAADIDLNNAQWTAIGTEANYFTGSFNGNGKTIKNLNIVVNEGKEGKAYLGFFGYAKNVEIKNVVFENANINIACLDIDHSQGHIGAVVGSLEGTSTIENVTVKGDIKVEATFDANGASRVAVVAGGNSYGDVTMKNVHVVANEGSYLKANNNTGALAGQLQGKNVFENCSSNIDVTVKKFFAGGIIGLAAGNSQFTDCHTTGNITVTAGREGRHNDEYRVGGIAGGWADNVNTPCVLTDCSYEGAVSGKNADGAVAEPLDCAGYVGRGYSTKVGSTVVVDETSYTYKGNGVYSVNGVVSVADEAQLLYAINSVVEGEVIALAENCVLSAVVNIAEGQKVSINLNGKTLSTAFVEGSTTNHLYAFENKGILTINDTANEGKIVARGIFNYGKMILENGTIDACDGNGGYGVRNYAGAEFVMNGGAIITSLEDDNKVDKGGYDATTLRVDEGATATINSGVINNISDFTFALDNNGDVVVKGGTFTSIHSTVSSYGDLTIEGGSFTCNGLEGVTAHCLVAWEGSETTIKGGTFDGKDNYNGFNVDACKGSVVNIEGGKFLSVHSGSLYGEGTINVTGGEFFDDPSARVPEGYKAVKTNDVWNVVVDPVAKVGTTEYATLQEAFNVGGNVTLLRNVTIAEPATLEGGKTVVLDLNGKTLTAELTSALVSKEGAELTVKNGTVIAYESTVRAIGGKAVVESGEYTSTGTALDSPSTYRYSLDCREGGELIINGGTFKSNNGMINVGSTVTVNGGKFENIVEKTMTRHFAYVSAPLTVNDGEFYGKANGAAGGCFFCGAAAGCDIQVNGGKFTSLWTSGKVNNIFEYYYGGTINVTGGMFNSNGGIKNFVVANTDEATKDAYPYVAK